MSTCKCGANLSLLTIPSLGTALGGNDDHHSADCTGKDIVEIRGYERGTQLWTNNDTMHLMRAVGSTKDGDLVTHFIRAGTGTIGRW